VAGDGPPRNEGDRFQAYRESGTPELRNELVEEHLDLARAFARRYTHRGVPLDDLEQVAQMNLIGAVERFDPGRGVKFSTFAGRTIDGALKRYFRDQAWSMKVPRQYQDLGVAVRSNLDRLTNELGRAPSIPELAAAVGADSDEVLAAMEVAQAFRVESIDTPRRGDHDGQPLAEGIGAADAAPLLFDDRDFVADLLGRLPERERQIVERRFFGEQSQREIAEAIGVSQMHVSRLLRKALLTLRTSLDER
jgi:RNA polymerase sigma-B factor